MKKIAVILTNQATYGNSDEKTGLWLAEATDFVKEVEAAGYGVDYISPKGGQVPIDPRSLKRLYINKEVEQVYQSQDFSNRALLHTLRASDVNASDYCAIYFTGGHGVVWDFPDNQDLQKLAQSIYENGGYVASVCHGLAGLLNISLSDGQNLISGKKVTGFTNMEEILSGKQRKVPFATETEAKKRGAIFLKKRPFASFAIADRRVVTGQNPMSGQAVAKLLLSEMSETSRKV